MSVVNGFATLHEKWNALRPRQAAVSEQVLFETLWRRACAIAQPICRDPVQAEDLATEAVLRACEHIDEVRDVGAFHAWFKEIAHNLAVSFVRQRDRHPQDGLESLVVAAPGASVSDVVAMRSRLAEAWRHLAPEMQLVFEQRYVEGLPVAEVAERLGRSPGTLRVQVHRARGDVLARVAERERAKQEYTHERRVALVETVLIPEFEQVEGTLHVALRNVSKRQIADAVELHPTLRRRYGTWVSHGVGDDIRVLGLPMMDPNLARSRTQRERLTTDPSFLEQLRRMRELSVDALATPEVRERQRRGAQANGAARTRAVEQRAEQLRDRVLLATFNLVDASGRYRPSHPVSLQRVVEQIKLAPRLRELYPDGGDQAIYDAVRADFGRLGQVAERTQKGSGERLKAKMAADATFAARVRSNAAEMAAKREARHAEHPEEAREAHRRSADAYRDKYEDPEFRELTLNRLAVGREKTQARSARRREALRVWVEARFGGVSAVTAKAVFDELVRTRPAEVLAHCKEFRWSTVVTDLAKLRRPPPGPASPADG